MERIYQKTRASRFLTVHQLYKFYNGGVIEKDIQVFFRSQISIYLTYKFTKHKTNENISPEYINQYFRCVTTIFFHYKTWYLHHNYIGIT